MPPSNYRLNKNPYNVILFINLIKFLRRDGRVGRRRSPAKRMYVLKDVPRVRIPLSPPVKTQFPIKQEHSKYSLDSNPRSAQRIYSLNTSARRFFSPEFLFSSFEFIAMPKALNVPKITTFFFPLVMAVYNKFFFSII